MLMTAADYRESLRAYRPRVFLDGHAVDSVADEPRFAPGLAAVGVTYDYAHEEAHRALMTARQATSGQIVNRMLHVDETADDLLTKLEAVRLVCRAAGCAQRYLAHDALSALMQATRRTDAAHGTDYAARFLVGADAEPPVVIDAGHQRDLDLAIDVTLTLYSGYVSAEDRAGKRSCRGSNWPAERPRKPGRRCWRGRFPAPSVRRPG